LDSQGNKVKAGHGQRSNCYSFCCCRRHAGKDVCIRGKCTWKHVSQVANTQTGASAAACLFSCLVLDSGEPPCRRPWHKGGGPAHATAEAASRERMNGRSRWRTCSLGGPRTCSGTHSDTGLGRKHTRTYTQDKRASERAKQGKREGGEESLLRGRCERKCGAGRGRHGQKRHREKSHGRRFFTQALLSELNQTETVSVFIWEIPLHDSRA